LFERALLIRESALASDHLNIAETLNATANVHRAKGRHEDAEPLFVRGLEIREKSLGSDHPWTKEARDSLEALRHAN
jgi:hypothetical protein